MSRPHFLTIENTVDRDYGRIKEAGKKGENNTTTLLLEIIEITRMKSEYLIKLQQLQMELSHQYRNSKEKQHSAEVFEKRIILCMKT